MKRMIHICVSMLFATVAHSSGYNSEVAEEDFTLSLQILTHTEILEQTEITDRQGEDRTTITLGTPISLRVVLANARDKVSQPIVASLLPEDGAHSIFIRRRDNPENRTRTMRWESRCRAVAPRALMPAESVALETWLFGVLDIRAGRVMGSRYVFDVPGEYEIYSVFTPRLTSSAHPEDGAVFLKKITSNVVVVDVTNPDESWPHLVAAGIVDAVEQGIDDSRRAQQEIQNMLGLIDSKTHPALFRWKATQIELNPRLRR